MQKIMYAQKNKKFVKKVNLLSTLPPLYLYRPEMADNNYMFCHNLTVNIMIEVSS